MQSATGTALPSGRQSNEPTVEERIANKDERVHVLTGAICNNNCLFCMEEDRDAREVTNSATTDEVVRAILADKRGCEEICFTSGEPTTNPRLPTWVKWAKEHGVRRISVMTNGRALSYEKYTRALIGAGMNRFYISIHGHNEKLHESLTRTPTSFDQTVDGLKMVNNYKRYGVELHTSTVITKRNLPFVGEIYRFLRALGVDQVVLNVMQANGRANTFFDKIFPTYTEIAAVTKAFLDDQMTREPKPMAFLVDIPLCTTTNIPDFNRGYVESYIHYEPAASAQALISVDKMLGRESSEIEGTALVGVRRSDLDDAARSKRDECRSCKYDASCEGVWGNYVSRYGWDEFVPVRA